MPVEKLVLHKKDNSACPTEMQSFRKENPNILRQPSPATSFYLPTYCLYPCNSWMGFCPCRHQTYLANDKGVPTGGVYFSNDQISVIIIIIYTAIFLPCAFPCNVMLWKKIKNCLSAEAAVAKVQLGDNDLNWKNLFTINIL